MRKVFCGCVVTCNSMNLCLIGFLQPLQCVFWGSRLPCTALVGVGYFPRHAHTHTHACTPSSQSEPNRGKRVLGGAVVRECVPCESVPHGGPPGLCLLLSRCRWAFLWYCSSEGISEGPSAFSGFLWPGGRRVSCHVCTPGLMWGGGGKRGFFSVINGRL